MNKMVRLEPGPGDSPFKQQRASSAFKFSPKLVTLSEAQPAAAEAIGALRSYLMVHHIDAGRRAAAVCAASEGVGCSFVAANLAVAMSQIGVKTLLIDGNTRRPAIERFIQPSQPRQGLIQCLSEDDALDEFVEPDVLPNLAVLFSGGVAAQPQELLAGERFEQLIELCLRDYDLTIVDTPPANTSADARRISNAVGYSLLVARSNKSYLQDLKTLTSQLREDHVRVIGSVLNEH
jgi:capsular exopolysaccharide synthesis family protein